MRKFVVIGMTAAVALAMMMFAGGGTASAACSADSSSGEDTRGAQIPPGGTPLGAGYLGAAGTSESGAIVGILGYAEQSASVSGGTISASGELNGSGVGYVEENVTVSGTNASGGIDGATGTGGVSGSGEINGTTVSDVEVLGICVQ